MMLSLVGDVTAVHGMNPQFLIEKIVRTRIYDALYWKEHCFALTAESIIEKAVALDHVGGCFGNQRPTDFLCLLLKMLQLQPEKPIVRLYLMNEEHKYLTALSALYLRLTFTSLECYTHLEPLLLDKRKLRFRNPDGSYTLTYMDEFADNLLRQERVCDIILPHINKRSMHVDLKELEIRVSPLEEDLELMEEGEEPAGDAVAKDGLDNDSDEEKKEEDEVKVQMDVDDDDRPVRWRRDEEKEDEVWVEKTTAANTEEGEVDGKDQKKEDSRCHDDQRDGDRDRRFRDKDREKNRDRDSERDRNRDRAVDRRDKGRRSRRDTDHYRRRRSRSISSSESSRSRSRDRRRGGRDRGSERDRKWEDERARDRERNRDRNRDEKEREREKEKERERDQEKDLGKKEKGKEREDDGAKPRAVTSAPQPIEGPAIPRTSEESRKKKWSSKKVDNLFRKAKVQERSLDQMVIQERALPEGRALGGETLSIEETNQQRMKMGLKPLTIGLRPGDAGYTGDVSMSIEETNRLRVSMGLKPLK
ncbi:hypothetical protein HDU67_000846 [Dinochytrium kinnereticum]|nr:hypothetical protein HDU67_000846 [Dinochytrium kinnereticum]